MKKALSHLTTFGGDLRRSFLDLATIIGVIAIFQFFVLQTVPANWPSMLIGLVVVGIGLAAFMRGLEVGIFPLGEDLAHHLASSSSRFWLILFAFVIGFATTIAEPALIAVAHKAAIISDGAINALILRLVVAVSVGCAIVLGVIRIILGHPIHWYIIAGYVLVLGVTYFAPPEIVGLAYDSGGVTTSTVTVPLIAALGIGLATYLKNRNPVIDGFGLIAFASLTPMIFVQLYGIVAYSLGVSVEAPSFFFLEGLGASSAGLTAFLSEHIREYVSGFFSTIGDVLPIILTILFFYYVALKKQIDHIFARSFGFLLVIIGLYLFVIGLELGLFPIGESIAAELSKTGIIWLIYIFAFAVGFATTIAEPALTAIARRAQEISGDAIRALYLRIFVAVGVGCGILLGAYRIVQGDSIVWYILVGYLIVVFLTYFAPRTIIPIAYDSGGVTTSTVTVPIVAALGLGLASSIPGRDPLIDGFGLIAFASLFPMIAVLSYGIFEREQIKREERRIRTLEKDTVSRVMRNLETKTDTVEKKLKKRHFRKKQIITITGTPGSGVSSTSKAVAEKLKFRRFSAGDLFRRIAKENNISVRELNKLAHENEAVDQEIDELIMELGHSDEKLVIDSKLAYHWLHNSFKVFLSVDPQTAAERVLAQSADNERTGEHLETLEDARFHIEALTDSEQARYREMYGIDIENTRPFHLVIDTAAKDLDQVVDTIISHYCAWIKER